jgi:hypothetical protein
LFKAPNIDGIGGWRVIYTLSIVRVPFFLHC